ncbi:hypothetical protein LU604_14775 [Erwinia tracheiphila]|uniref:Uncharacterized protein n=1 Tax=Erwinia tracheiphila TaxID=65700 RepID=A0A345CQ08_9GAMM|nr:hypothetical protein [Erwinia tracheiphila]AXF75525.1 hypothetical protein AV903_04440 [Erwinia tracheiphila]UIA81930.1 hypothetical protein LU604_14775 [Erwinia tracheiphila]UIA90526.1 hypothetical protein LU632_14350 [Erwinia tracheiphila]
MTREEIEECLDFDLFQGDFGEPGDCELSNKIVKGQQKYTCFVCDGPIKPGEIHRYTTWKFSEIFTYRCCNECCVAMVNSINGDYLDTDDGEDPIDARYALGEKRRNGEPA